MNNKEVDILDILLLLAKHKKFIFFFVLIVSIATVVYVLVVPEYWVSIATILPSQSEKGALSFSGSSLLGLGTSFLGGSFHTSGTDLITIMKSRTFSEDVIKKFNLTEYMELEDSDSLVVNEKALEFLRENIRTLSLDEESGLISISIETKDKYLSARIANYYRQKLEKYNIENKMSKGKQKRIFLEARVDEVKSTLDSLSQELLAFQKENNIIMLEEQTSAIVQLYSELIIQKNKKEIELEFAKSFSSPQSPNLKKIEHENIVLENKIADLEELNSDSKHKYILSLDSIPNKALEFANLKMNLKIQESIFSFLFPQYEESKIEEIKDLPTIEVIDKARPSGLRSKPKRARQCVTNFILAVIISIFISFVIEYISNNVEKVRNIREILLKK